jgi:oligosaccharide repeat unit polymerase
MMILLFPFLLVAITLWFFLVQTRRRQGKAQYLDLGLAFLVIVTVYGTLPGVGLALAHFDIGEIRDVRVAEALDFDLVQDIQIMFLCFAVGLSTVYLWKRKYPIAEKQTETATARQVLALICIAVLLNAGLPLAKYSIGAQASADYIGTYLELREFPLFIQQIFNLASQVAFSSLVASVVFFVAWKPSKHLHVAAVLIIYVGFATLAGGSRTFAFLSLFAYLIAASVFVPRFSMSRLVPLGALALFLFLLAGNIRGEVESGVLGMLQDSEFMSIFINALDLHARVLDGEVKNLGLSFYLTDLLRLVPSQLIGAKIEPAVWYVETFYPNYHAAGGGLAFGVLAESVVGFGAVEAFARGSLLGLIFALCANALRPESRNPVRVFVYVWLTVVSYQAFRDTTLSMLVRALFQLGPVLLVLLVVSPKPGSLFVSRARRFT